MNQTHYIIDPASNDVLENHSNYSDAQAAALVHAKAGKPVTIAQFVAAVTPSATITRADGSQQTVT